MQIRIRETGAVVTEHEFRAMHPNTGFPSQLTENIINDFGGDVVFEGPQASGGEFWQYSMPNGLKQLNGKWYTNYVLGPVFSDITKEDGTVISAEEQLAQHIQQKTVERIERIKSEILDATQKRLDDFAQTRYYTGILSACTYATSTVPQFKSDGQYAVNARDMTWSKLYQMLGEVEAGKRPMPSGYAEIEAELPALVWP